MANRKVINYRNSILTSPMVFFIIGIIEVILFSYTWYYFSTHRFFDPTTRGGLHLLNLQLGKLIGLSVIFISYSVILKIIKPVKLNRKMQLIFKSISLIIILLFIVGLIYFFNFWQDPSLYTKNPLPGMDVLY